MEYMEEDIEEDDPNPNQNAGACKEDSRTPLIGKESSELQASNNKEEEVNSELEKKESDKDSTSKLQKTGKKRKFELVSACQSDDPNAWDLQDDLLP